MDLGNRNYYTGELLEGELPKARKYDYLLQKNQKYMNYAALSFGSRRITFEEMHERIHEYARALYRKGIRRGDMIGVCVLNTPESVYLLYALDMIGAIVVGFSPLDNEYKIRRDLELVRPKMVITVDMMYHNFRCAENALHFSTVLYSPMQSADSLGLKAGYKLLQLKRKNFSLSSKRSLKSIVRAGKDSDFKPAEYQEQELTDIMFTGGSTGIHKGVDLTGNGLNCVVEGMNEVFEVEPGMIHLGNIPFGHMVFGRMILHYALSNNMELALTLKAGVEDFYDELVRTKANAAVGGPPHWVSLTQKQDGKYITNPKVKKGSLSQLIYATSGGEAKKAATESAINEALRYAGSDTVLGDGLGATELWASIIINNGRRNTPGTIGFPLPYTKIKLVDPETGEEVPDGKPGLLNISGPTVMLGYHNNPDETQKVMTFDTDGTRWYNSGDILAKTETGEYKYVGRQKRNFVSGVDNIYPEELESLLQTLPEISEVVVTKIPDNEQQFLPCYHISVLDDQVDRKRLEDKICQLVTSKLGTSWLPGYIEYLDKPLEKMANTKVNVAYYQDQDLKDFEAGKLGGKTVFR